jgi:hypothetical protein
MKQEYHSEKQTAGEIVVKNPILTWLENFWYHHKWAVLVTLFFLFTVTVCLVQCSSVEPADLTVAFAGAGNLSPGEKEGVIGAMETLTPKNEEGGRKSVLLNSCYILTEEELRALHTDAEHGFSPDAYSSHKNLNTNNLATFSTFVKTGETALWLVSPYVFDYQNLDKLALPLSELYGEEIPPSAYNEYAIRLGDTDFYKYYDSVKVLPEDTLIVLSRRFIMGSSSDEAVYKDFTQLFRAIVDFEAPKS